MFPDSRRHIFYNTDGEPLLALLPGNMAALLSRTTHRGSILAQSFFTQTRQHFVLCQLSLFALRTNTDTHKRIVTHTHMQKHSYRHTNIKMHTNRKTHMHKRIHTHKDTGTNTQTHTNTPVRPHSYTQHTQSDRNMHKNTRKNTHTHTATDTNVNTHINAHTQTQTNTHTDTHTGMTQSPDIIFEILYYISELETRNPNTDAPPHRHTTAAPVVEESHVFICSSSFFRKSGVDIENVGEHAREDPLQSSLSVFLSFVLLMCNKTHQSYS